MERSGASRRIPEIGKPNYPSSSADVRLLLQKCCRTWTLELFSCRWMRTVVTLLVKLCLQVLRVGAPFANPQWDWFKPDVLMQSILDRKTPAGAGFKWQVFRAFVSTVWDGSLNLLVGVFCSGFYHSVAI
ncbi:uncharacterized protein LY89DRAFT_181603 [Mollisia scopiformis]|uniref:Uncharacterized protein n=1 Tax=Mollisia scopiformis TaxID=149040 RepID=A0A194XTD9_MOLSC|nr:uncharacterized protein LY89DRAFT_181603 [Mollisia scopiformis]KUJ23411.1 hypothetical protein LY89DRAFT_181603 [Mollisia scopiformis]